jgi:parallel beta-helix repeat protein
MMKREKLAAVLLAAATVLGFAASAGAVDGVIEINQAKVLASGGSFPFVISKSGSYRLTGNLTVPGSVDGIDVTAPNVTIDMNGFSITGTSGTTVGINASLSGEATVENGSITGFGVGVEVGGFSIVRKVRADENGSGIQGGSFSVIEGCVSNFSLSPTGFEIGCREGCTISGNTANGHGGNGDGIDCIGNGFGCVISGNTVTNNGKVGINCLGDGCVISGNTAISNGGAGLLCGGSGCVFTGNTAVSNTGAGISAGDTTSGYGGNVLKNTSNVSGGTSLGHNLCSGTVC